MPRTCNDCYHYCKSAKLGDDKPRCCVKLPKWIHLPPLGAEQGPRLPPYSDASKCLTFTPDSEGEKHE